MIKFEYNIKGIATEDEFKPVIDEARSFVARAQEDAFGGWVDLPVDEELFCKLLSEKCGGKLPE